MNRRKYQGITTFIISKPKIIFSYFAGLVELFTASEDQTQQDFHNGYLIDSTK